MKDFAAEIEAKLILKQLMLHLLREERETEGNNETNSNQLLERIREVANYIKQHPAKPHTVESLAAQANLSPVTFPRSTVHPWEREQFMKQY